MPRTRYALFCLLIAALGLSFAGLGVQRLQAQAAKAEKTSVAVVNVADLIAKCQKNVEFQEQTQKRRSQLQAEQEEKQKKINLLRGELDIIGDAAARAKKENEIIKVMSEFQAWQQIQQQVLLRDQRVFLIELYGDIDKTVASVAQREGYDLVLFDTPSPDFEQLNAEQLVQAIGNRRIIFRTDRVDLTPVVLQQMNLNHLNRGGN